MHLICSLENGKMEKYTLLKYTQFSRRTLRAGGFMYLCDYFLLSVNSVQLGITVAE